MKRPLLDVGDLLILLGACMLLAGLYLYDWRLALAALGGLIMLMGTGRLIFRSRITGGRV